MKKTIITITTAIMLFASTAYALESFRIYRNHSGDQTLAIPQGYVNSYLLTANTAKTISIPTGARYVIFTATADIWARIGTVTAVVPVGDINNGTGSELNPDSPRWVEGETQISVISEYAAKVSIAFWK